MVNSNANRNLLFGILALQMDFISREQLISAASSWVRDKSRRLDQLMVEQGALSDDAHALLAQLVEKHLEMHDHDPDRSLASLTSVRPSLRDDLKALADTDVEASLTHLAAQHDEDDEATRTFRVGVTTTGSARFRILRPYAQGGLGRVSVALDEELNREVALKEIQAEHAASDDNRARFVQEAEVTGRLEHPCIVPVYGLGQYDDGRPFYVMRFIRGGSLKEAIDRFHQGRPAEKGDSDQAAAGVQRSLELRKLLGRFTDVCNAVAYAHSRGVLHRDLKPGNVMLGKYGETLVVDWGLAKAGVKDERSETGDEPTLRRASAKQPDLTSLGSMIGTPAYMSPEQATGQLATMGPASDVYSLGATLYCVLTGQRPFTGALDQILKKVEAGDFPRPRQVTTKVPPALDAICLKAMARRAVDRYPTAHALAQDIERWLADETVDVYAEPFVARARRFVRRHQAFSASLAAGLLVGLVSLAVISGLATASNRRLATANGTIGRQKSRLEEQNGELQTANRQLVLARREADQRRRQAEQVQGYLVEIFRSPDPELDGRAITVARMLDRAAERLAGDEEGPLTIRPALLTAIGKTYVALGLPQEAVQTLQTARQLALDEAGPDDPATLEASGSLALACGLDGGYDEAISLLEETIERLGAIHDPDHPSILTCQLNLAECYVDAGRVRDALPLLEETLPKYRQALGANDADFIGARNNLGKAYVADGRLEEAIEVLGQTLTQARAQLGLDHPGTLRLINNLAAAYYSAGKIDEAIPMFEESLQQRREWLGDGHPATIGAQSNLAAAYFRASRQDEGVRLLEEALAAASESLAADHQLCLVLRGNLGTAYRGLGRLPEAIEMNRETLGLIRAKFTTNHPYTITAMNNLGTAYASAGQLEEAIPLYEEALRLRKQSQGPGHPSTVNSMDNLAQAYVEAGEFEKAIPLYRDLVAQLRKARPANTARLSENLVRSANCLLQLDKPSEAEPLLSEAWQLRKAALPDDWSTANTQSLLGEALASQEQFARSEPLLLDAYQNLAAKREEIPAEIYGKRMRQAADRLASLYKAWSKPELAAAWEQRRDEFEE